MIEWFHDKHKVNLKPSSLQLLVKDYKFIDQCKKELLILILQTQKYYYQCKMLEKAANSSDLATQVLAQWKLENAKILHT